MNSPEKNIFKLNGALHLLLLFVCVAALGTAAFAQKTKTFGGTSLITKQLDVINAVQPEVTSPTPTYVAEANLDCSDLVGLKSNTGSLPFPGVTAATHEFKYGESASNYNFGPHTFRFDTYTETGFGPVVTDTTAFTDRLISFSVSSTSTDKTLISFSSQLGISAVIMKLGQVSYAYDFSSAFPGYVSSGGPLNVTAQNGFSHIIFCFENTPRPTAAEVSVSGRVLTADGRAVSGARITITNAGTGRTYIAMTNPFGYYTIENLDSEAFYVATIAKKGTKFVEDSKSFSLTDNLADLDFVANQ